MQKKIFLLIIIFGLSIYISAQDSNVVQSLCEQSKIESLKPIHSGVYNKLAFWNENATMFKYAPSFNFSNSSWVITNPKHYLYTAFSFENNQYYKFTANSPYEPLTPIWDKIPNGKIYLKVEAVNEDESNFVLAGEKQFYKAAVFCPPYEKAKIPYRESLLKGINYLYTQQHIKDWYDRGKPNHQLHILYCYSALEVGSVIDAMILYRKYYSQNDSAIVIAKNAADYLIANSEKKGNYLEYFPQVYEGKNLTAEKFEDEILITQPSFTAQTYLALFEATNEKKYFDAAINIADTYLKNQLANGTWHIRVNKKTGKPVSDILSIPIAIVKFLSVLADRYQIIKYQHAIDSAIAWIWGNTMQTYDWTGQFEDVEANKPYQNLTKYEASWFAQFLLNKSNSDSTYFHYAKELIAFCEDQFVVWSNPNMYDNWGNSTKNWRTPSVLEQYKCYVPIDASSAQMINTFYLAFEISKEKIYRDKAIALANSLVNSQNNDGRISTFWANGFSEFWNNCMVSDLYMLDNLISKKEGK